MYIEFRSISNTSESFMKIGQAISKKELQNL